MELSAVEGYTTYHRATCLVRGPLQPKPPHVAQGTVTYRESSASNLVLLYSQGVSTIWNYRAMLTRRRNDPRLHQRWLRSKGAHDWLIRGHGMIALIPWNDTHVDHATWRCGHYFTTHAHAERARDKRQESVLPFPGTAVRGGPR